MVVPQEMRIESHGGRPAVDPVPGQPLPHTQRSLAHLLFVAPLARQEINDTRGGAPEGSVHREGHEVGSQGNKSRST